MIYQELNLPIWAQVVVAVIVVLFGIYIARIEPTEEPTEAPKEESEQIPQDHVKERYGAYIQAQGHYYN